MGDSANKYFSLTALLEDGVEYLFMFKTRSNIWAKVTTNHPYM